MKNKSILILLTTIALGLSACGTSSDSKESTSSAPSENSTSATSSSFSSSATSSSSSSASAASSSNSNTSSSQNEDDDSEPAFPNYVLHGKYNGDNEWTDKPMVLNPYSTTEYMALGVSLTAGDEFVIHMYGDTWYKYSDVKSSTPSGLVTAASSDNNIKVLTTGVYDIYSDYNSDGGHIYLDRVDKTTPISGDVSVTGISLSNSGKYLLARNEFTLTATVLPNNATNTTVYWTSSDTSIATVSNGRVVANKDGKKGTTTITAKTADGNKTAECIVYVSSSFNFPTVGNPDYCLTGTIGGKTLNTFKQKYAAIPLSDGRYLIPDVDLVKNDSVSVINNQGATLKNSSNQTYTKSVSSNMSVNVYLKPNDSNKNYLSFVAKASS